MSFDPHYNSVSLLLHCDGADGSTTFVDKSPSPKTVAAYGNAKVSSTQSRWGASAYFDGSGDYLLAAPVGSSFAFGTGDFTVECWVNTSTTAEKIFVGCYNSSITSWQLNIYQGKLYWYSIGNHLAGSLPINDGAWHHIAATRSSGVLRLFVDGVLDKSISLPSNYANQLLALEVGAQVNARNSAYDLVGYIDEIRITKGVARYTANFTPPTEPFAETAAQPALQARIAASSLLGAARAVVQSVSVVRASASGPLGAARAAVQSVRVTHANASSPLGAGQVLSYFGEIYFARIAAHSPLGAAQAMAQTVTAARIATTGPLGAVRAKAQTVTAARIATTGLLGAARVLAFLPLVAFARAPSPLGAGRALAYHDFTVGLGDAVTLFVMDLVTPTGTVRIPISSWQATLQTGGSNYVQCVIPACTMWVDTINTATEFVIYRRAVLPNGTAIEYEMARAPAASPQFDQGPQRQSCTLSGYSDAFAASENPPAIYDRALSGIRSISSGSSYRVRCAVDWLLRPGHRAFVQGAPFVVTFINYYAPSEFDCYMDVGS